MTHPMPSRNRSIRDSTPARSAECLGTSWHKSNPRCFPGTRCSGTPPARTGTTWGASCLHHRKWGCCGWVRLLVYLLCCCKRSTPDSTPARKTACSHTRPCKSSPTCYHGKLAPSDHQGRSRTMQGENQMSVRRGLAAMHHVATLSCRSRQKSRKPCCEHSRGCSHTMWERAHHSH